MVVAKAKLKITDILETLAGSLELQSVDEFSLRRQKIEVNKLLNDREQSAAFCYCALGLIAVFERKYDDCISYFENSFKLDASYLQTYQQYGRCLRRMGDLRKSMEISVAATKKFPGNKSLVHDAVIACQKAGYFEQSGLYIQQYNQLAINDAVNPLKDANVYNSFSLEKLKMSELSEEDMLLRCEFVIKTIRDRGFLIFESEQLVLRDGSYFEHFYIDATVETCTELNFEIAMSLVENFDDVAMELCTFKSRPVAFYKNIEDSSK